MRHLFSNRWLLLIIISVTWGSSFILIKKSLSVFDPWQIGAFRVGISGLLLVFPGIKIWRKLDRNTRFWVIVTGFFGNFLPMFLFPLAQTKISSALAGILDSLVPAFVLALGFVFFGIRSRAIQVLGACIGFAGAFFLMYFSDGQDSAANMGYALLVVLATACYALSGLLVKEKLAHVPSLSLSAAVYCIWMIPSLFILVFSGFFTRLQWERPHLEALGYLTVLTVVGTAIAMMLYYKLIQSTTAVFASTVTYLLPLVAVLWGLMDGEPFTIWYMIGGALILWGVYLLREPSEKVAAKRSDAQSGNEKPAVSP